MVGKEKRKGTHSLRTRQWVAPACTDMKTVAHGGGWGGQIFLLVTHREEVDGGRSLRHGQF